MSTIDEALTEAFAENSQEPATEVDTGVAPEAGAEGEGETVSAEGGNAESAQAPELDVNQYGDHMVTVKVNGETLTVPLKEAVNGYSRTEDYTRKTQALSEQVKFAQTLQAALESDPQNTLALLQERYGVAEANRMVDEAQDTIADQTGIDPRLSAYEQRLAAIEAREYEQQLSQTIQGLQAKYGEAFNPQEVARAALEMDMTSLHQLETVFKILDYDRKSATTEAQSMFTAQKAAADAQREAAKSADGNVVAYSEGGGANAAGLASGQVNSLEDAWNLARAEAGIS